MLTVYSKESCSQCDATKRLLTVRKVEFEVKMLDVDFTREDLEQLAPTQKSFPIVFNGEALIGGFMELRKWIAAK